MKLYYNDMSPPVRAVLLTARALDIEFDLHEVNIFNKEQLSEEYLQVRVEFTAFEADFN